MIEKISQLILVFIFRLLAGKARNAGDSELIKWLEAHDASVMCARNGHTAIFLHGDYEGCEMISGSSFRDAFSDAAMRAAAFDAANRARDAA
jgi:hypothetical protein